MKFQVVSLCVLDAMSTQGREFERVITPLLDQLRSSICVWLNLLLGDTWTVKGKLRFCEHLITDVSQGSGHFRGCCLLFITKIQTLRVFFVFLSS